MYPRVHLQLYNVFIIFYNTLNIPRQKVDPIGSLGILMYQWLIRSGLMVSYGENLTVNQTEFTTFASTCSFVCSFVRSRNYNLFVELKCEEFNVADTLKRFTVDTEFR